MAELTDLAVFRQLASANGNGQHKEGDFLAQIIALQNMMVQYVGEYALFELERPDDCGGLRPKKKTQYIIGVLELDPLRAAQHQSTGALNGGSLRWTLDCIFQDGYIRIEEDSAENPNSLSRQAQTRKELVLPANGTSYLSLPVAICRSLDYKSDAIGSVATADAAVDGFRKIYLGNAQVSQALNSISFLKIASGLELSEIVQIKKLYDAIPGNEHKVKQSAGRGR